MLVRLGREDWRSHLQIHIQCQVSSRVVSSSYSEDAQPRPGMHLASASDWTMHTVEHSASGASRDHDFPPVRFTQDCSDSMARQIKSRRDQLRKSKIDLFRSSDWNQSFGRLWLGYTCTKILLISSNL